jgi:hypothetical protein
MQGIKWNGYLINPSGVMIKPKGKRHRAELLNKGGGWVTNPETGEMQNAGGFRIATEEEVAKHLADWAMKSKRMQQLDLQAKKQNAQLVMMAPDEAQLERMIEAREERKRQAKADDEDGKKKKTKAE